MASPNLDTLFPLLLPSLPECPLDTVRSAVRRAAADFCRQSTAWRTLLDPVLLQTGVRDYPLATPDDTEVALLCNVYTPQGELVGKSLDHISSAIPDWAEAIGQPRFFNSLDYAAASLYPAPAAHLEGVSYIVRVALSPKRSIEDLPTLLTERHDEALVEGALARLYAMAGRPWTQLAQVASRQAAFDRLTVAARIAVEHERVRGSICVKPRRFGA